MIVSPPRPPRITSSLSVPSNTSLARVPVRVTRWPRHVVGDGAAPRSVGIGASVSDTNSKENVVAEPSHLGHLLLERGDPRRVLIYEHLLIPKLVHLIRERLNPAVDPEQSDGRGQDDHGGHSNLGQPGQAILALGHGGIPPIRLRPKDDP